MTIFDDMNDDFFTNEDLVETAIYFKDGAGVGVGVPVYLNEKDMESDIAGFTALSTGRELEVRISDIAQIRVGDEFEFKGIRHRVKSDPIKDEDALNWRIELGG